MDIINNNIQSSLGFVPVLFIPFDAAGKFYKANVQAGIKGHSSYLQDDGSKIDIEDTTFVAGFAKKEQFMTSESIGLNLNRIVQQECDLIRGIYQPGNNFQSVISSYNSNLNFDTLSDSKKQKIIQILGGYKNYPLLIFLSENSTKKPFPDWINCEYGISYKLRGAITNEDISGLRPVNQMAVYARENMYAYTITAENITRGTTGLFGGGKKEYILKVTVSRENYSLTLAGVHLRAKLTSASELNCKREFEDLQKFCASQNIQLMIGDFNMDLQETARGSRGVFLPDRRDLSLATAQEKDQYFNNYQPKYIAKNTEETIGISYMQQYSNSTGNSHYMGYYQADTEGLTIEGPGVYGLMGASGSRYLKSEELYYSDHPSIYVCLDSKRT